MKLDRTDFLILDQLQQDARISNKDLADRVGISPSTCLERVRRLIGSRAITGFHADVNPASLGIGVQAMIAVRLGRHADISFDKLLAELRDRPEVVHVYLLAGAEDVLIHVAVRDVAHLRTLVIEHLTTRSDVAHIETSLIFEFSKAAVLPNYLKT